MIGVCYIHSSQETKQINTFWPLSIAQLLAPSWGYLTNIKVLTVDSFYHFNGRKASSIKEPSKNHERNN